MGHEQKIEKPFWLTIGFFCWLLAFLTLLGLGSWQALKIGPKTAFIKAIEDGLAQPPVTLSGDEAPSEFIYRQVKLRAGFVDSQALRLFGTNLKGQAGYHLYGFLKTEKGQLLLANRGFVALDQSSFPPLETELNFWQGRLMTAAQASAFTPKDDPAHNLWYLANPERMGQSLTPEMRAQLIPQIRLIADTIDENSQEIEMGQFRFSIPNNHQQYMLTWYSLAFLWLVIFVWRYRARRV